VFRYHRESATLSKGRHLQRLFSNFANGWPGKGLLVLRLLTAAIAFELTLARAGNITVATTSVTDLIQVGAGFLLLVGLWTPVVGTLLAAVEVWLLLSHFDAHSARIVLATLSAAVAMIGPGFCSIDARLFGRKVVEVAEGHPRKSGGWRE
jgi:putative oxidoreductase